MIDGQLCDAIQAKLIGEFPTIFVGRPQDHEQIPANAVLMELQSDVVVGSPLQRGMLALNVCSQADDNTPEQHTNFAGEIDAFMRTLTLNSNVVQLYGIVCQSVNLLREERHWRTTINYVLGYGPKV